MTFPTPTDLPQALIERWAQVSRQLDDLPDSDVAAYVRTMERLRELPVTVVHGGHEPSFGRERLIEIATDYIERRR